MATYLTAREWLLENDPDAPRMISWSESVRPPDTAEQAAGEIIWIILCAGRSAQSARTIERKVWAAIHEGRPVVEAFGYRKKAEAIERAWTEREADFANLQAALGAGNPAAALAWCRSIPFVGDVTKYQLAKNFGIDVCKPDIWLCRLAGIPDRPAGDVEVRFAASMRLCRAMSEATGERLATVDSVLWLACNKRVLVTDDTAAAISLNVDPPDVRSIYESATLAAGD
ncbi:hypothetical protein [Paraburkholderia youngii]|uniref:hypothetical protein n=1 Tax=Paraburkholderia youngii TaxID=2782701 RepID=UPI003D20BE17